MSEHSTATNSPKDSSGKLILLYFVMFFGFIATMDGIFVYMAISTQTGVVTDQAYERGLAFNDIVEKAKSQPLLNQTANYESGVLRWKLADDDNNPLTSAIVSARIIRPVQDGYDHDITLEHQGNGIYEVHLNLPLQGRWRAKLISKWDDKQYQSTFEFIK